MFTVNIVYNALLLHLQLFQNISCLRLIKIHKKKEKSITLFQNISCLRLMTAVGIKAENEFEFQNMSCLRLICVLLFLRLE